VGERGWFKGGGGATKGGKVLYGGKKVQGGNLMKHGRKKKVLGDAVGRIEGAQDRRGWQVSPEARGNPSFRGASGKSI